jgi:hypothetical protein
LLDKKKVCTTSNAGFWTRRKLAGQIRQVAGQEESLHKSNAGFLTRRKLEGQGTKAAG